MFRISNNLIGLLNFLTFLLSIPILAGGIWLSARSTTNCDKFLDRPIIVVSVFLMVGSLIGLAGACCCISCLLWLYLFVMFLHIVLLFYFTIFAFAKRVNDSENWSKIKSCLADSNVYKTLEASNDAETEFYKRSLSPVQSGCCKPPTSCNFTYVNATVWNKPEGSTDTYSDLDCLVWNNDQNTLCYNCQSCKAGVLANLKRYWKKVVVVSIIFLIFLIIVYTVGCCAFRNNREDNAFRWKG
ncbi:hypothetical protein MRB53_030458 [Persea americana]|uniref:Uncharacterized protein n=1 Tax=Persea americana TaxID=3435 RepID=A0ACC2KLU5_PERAE|nr:hypothetical protein MRB53_030458 [Persea americana]